MSSVQWWLEVVLIGLLALTLFHAFRLEKALGVLRRDRASLEELVAGFNDSTRQAEGGIDRLRAVADGAGRQIARQVDQAKALQNDLAFLTERGEKLADRLDSLVRQAAPKQEPAEARRPADVRPMPLAGQHPEADGRVRSQAEKELLRALRMAR